MEKRHAKIKKRKQSLLYTPIGIGFLAAILLYLGYSTFGVYTKWSDAHAKLTEARAAYTATVERHDAISDDLHTLSTDRGKEEIIREKFNVVKEGEGVVVLPNTGAAQEEAAAVKPKEKKGFWQFLKAIFVEEK